jgi:hypothetical protein
MAIPAAARFHLQRRVALIRRARRNLGEVALRKLPAVCTAAFAAVLAVASGAVAAGNAHFIKNATSGASLSLPGTFTYTNPAAPPVR